MKVITFEYGRQHSTDWHEHTSGQLYWLSHGIIVIETAYAQWTVTPGTVGWFPPGLTHRAWVPGKVKGHSLYLASSPCFPFPADPGVYGADAFILALLERCRQHQASSSDDYQNNLLTLLAYEIAHRPSLPLELTLPVDRRARNVASELLKNPECALDQNQLAEKWGLSTRTLSRLFNQQTGLSFSQWRQQSKVIASLQWILAGLPISEVASLSGYTDVSAFIEVFRLRFGKTPGQFRQANAP